jgi:hypothetical protein
MVVMKLGVNVRIDIGNIPFAIGDMLECRYGTLHSWYQWLELNVGVDKLNIVLLVVTGW